MSKQDIEKKETKISVCDIMKDNTSEMIKKIETQVPLSMQQYSDLYTAYLHTIDDLFGTCYISEKEFFDKLNIDQSVLKELREFSKTITKTYLDNIEISSKSMGAYIQMRISSLKVYDDFIRTMMESYAKTLSQFNKSMQ